MNGAGGVDGPGRELRPTAAAGGVAVLVVLSWSVWTATGSRTALFICVAALAAAGLDVAWGALATWRLRLSVDVHQTEATAGDPVRITVTVAGAPRFVRVTAPTFAAPQEGVEAPGRAELAGQAVARRVVTAVDAELVTPGIAGLVAFARRRAVPLPRPLFVGPRPVPASEPMPDLFRPGGESEARASPGGDVVRGVRPYVRGDPRRRVHWTATARLGELVVKEVDEPVAARLLLALDLGGGGAAGERAAGRAAWYALEGLRRAYEVELVTVERGARTVSGAVTSPAAITRRLAAAEPGRPELPEGEGLHVLVVTAQGDSWR